MISMIENPNIDPYIYDQILFGQRAKNVQLESVVSLTKVVG